MQVAAEKPAANNAERHREISRNNETRRCRRRLARKSS